MKKALVKSIKSLGKSIPLIIATILAVSLLASIIPSSFYKSVFHQNAFVDSIIGSAIGSIAAGNPISSYVLGGELLGQGISLMAVTAFLVSWVTVGLVQIPAEASLLGRRFTFLRNLTAFFLAIITAIVTTFLVSL